jgi:membrane-bound serine protease (ClpP class)
MTNQSTYPTAARRRRNPEFNVTLLLAFFVLFATFCSNLYSAPDPTITEGSVVVLPIEGAISEPQFIFLRRILKEAETAKASAIILDMDTPGGRLDVTQDIVQLLTKSTIPTYTWVNTNAASAGALIALATKHVYMTPVSAIGAAAPVMGGGQDIPETMKKKTVSYNSAYFRGVAEANDYDPNLADAFMDETKEFKIGDDVISAKDELLTLTPSEAMRQYDGRRLLADGTASDLDELKEKAGLQGATVRVEPSGFERAAHIITLLAPLFLLGGIIGAYLEFKSPGFGVAGFLAAASFLVFFVGHSIAGLTGFEVVAVFGLGLLLVLFELFFFPGLIIVSLVGSALMLGSVFFAMIDYYPGDPVIPPIDALVTPMINLGITTVLAIVIITTLARYLPELPVFRRLILATRNPLGSSITTPTRDVYDLAAKVGDTGIARSTLRPSGKAQIGAALHDVITDGEYLEIGTPIRVIEATSNRILVTTA